MGEWHSLRDGLLAGELLSAGQALALADGADTAALCALAAELRDQGHGNVITYSRKVFIPLTQLCRDVCHYCTFAQTPKKIERPFMSVEEVLQLCREGARQGCQEALFTLGERPELRYGAARRALQELGFSDTLSYVHHVAERVLEETGLLPHINAGCMDAAEIAGLRQVSASMGIMLESASPRLCEKGMPHYGSPDKVPARRLQTLELAGEAAVPFTSGILIGIGETRRERVESLLALRAVHQRHGHLQEVIVQNFRAKPGTLMARAPEPDLDELLWSIAIARLVFGPEMNIQAPPNLSPGVLPQLVARRHQRLGRRVAADAGSCQSGGALASPGGAGAGDRRRRQVPGSAPDHLPRLRQRAPALAGSGPGTRGAAPERQRGFCPA